jgi:glycosyltransferase involved in cell wall biosynthesis
LITESHTFRFLHSFDQPRFMTTRQPKLLFFATEDWFVCSHWLPLILGAKDEGFEVIVVTRTNKHAEKIRKYGVKVIHFEISRRGTNVFREFGTILRLTKIYRTERPDIVHHVAMKPMLYGSLAAHLVRVPSAVNWVSGMGWLFISKSRRAQILQTVVRKVIGVLLRGTEVIVENKDDHAVMTGLGISDRHLHLIRGAGVDTSMYAPVPEPEGEPIVVLPARMLWDKGVGEFVEAATLLKRRGVSARFVLVGEPDGENPASVPEHKLVSWQKDGVVEWWGRREDMPQILAQSHIVCLPSYREGLPKSLLEASSSGRPIVTTDVPGCREIVRDGDNGILVEVRNPVALADALAKLLADPELRQQMGQCGRERVMNEFSQEIITSQVLAIYREAVLGIRH